MKDKEKNKEAQETLESYEIKIKLTKEPEISITKNNGGGVVY